MLAGSCLLASNISNAVADDSTAEYQEQSVSKLLEKMGSSEQYLNYDGSFVYTAGSTVTNFDIWHRFDNGGESERLLKNDGVEREILRDSSTVYRMNPSENVLTIEPRRPFSSRTSRLLKGLESSSEVYEYSVNGEETVAGHTCSKVSIFPKDHLRYGYRLCVDENSGLLIKFQTVDVSGQLLEQMIFTELRIPENPQAIEMPDENTGFEIVRVAESPMMLNTPIVKLSVLPLGFKIVSEGARKLAGHEKAVQHIIVDDGLASVSIFVAFNKESTDSEVKETLKSSGAMRSLSRFTDGFQTIILGEVPHQTLKVIADGLNYKKLRSLQ